jgi:hypothetical protein
VPSTGQGDNPESIGETWSEVVVDVPGFTETSQEYQGRSTATPINDFKSDILSGLTRYGKEPDVLRGRIGPVGPLGVGTMPRRKELGALLAKRTYRQTAGAAGGGSRRHFNSTATAARREAGDCEQHQSNGDLTGIRLRHECANPSSHGTIYRSGESCAQDGIRLKPLISFTRWGFSPQPTAHSP